MAKKKKEIVVATETIQEKILLIRGKRVMIDRDLAELNEVETRVLNQAVRRNIGRFPSDFMFHLTREEILNLSQIVIGSKIKHAPNVFAFTEHGVAMLSSVLKSKTAIEVNIQIMRTFVKTKEMMLTHSDLKKKIGAIEKKLTAHDEHIRIAFNIMAHREVVWVKR